MNDRLRDTPRIGTCPEGTHSGTGPGGVCTTCGSFDPTTVHITDDRLRETDELVAKNLRIESKVILEIARQIKRGEADVGDDLDYISDIMREAADTIERQGNAIEDLELRLHQTNDAHALSCSEHLKALTEIERQGKALRAVEALCDEADAYYRQEFTGMVLTKEIRAALAQTEPQASKEPQT